MSKVTSKRQVTVPKALAERFGIEPGTELRWEVLGDRIRVIPDEGRGRRLGVEARLELFDAATRRQQRRQAGAADEPGAGVDRGWTREELYERARSRRH